MLKESGVDTILERNDDFIQAIGEDNLDVAVDNVASDHFRRNLSLLKRNGQFEASGAIAGHSVSLNLRKFYLKDTTLMASATWDDAVFGNIIDYIEQEVIQPFVEKIFPLR